MEFRLELEVELESEWILESKSQVVRQLKPWTEYKMGSGNLHPISRSSETKSLLYFSKEDKLKATTLSVSSDTRFLGLELQQWLSLPDPSSIHVISRNDLADSDPMSRSAAFAGTAAHVSSARYASAPLSEELQPGSLLISISPYIANCSHLAGGAHFSVAQRNTYRVSCYGDNSLEDL